MQFEGPTERKVRWPSEKMFWARCAHIFGVVALLLAGYVQYQQFTLLERWWFPQYCWMHWRTYWQMSPREYDYLAVEESRKFRRLALDSDVLPDDRPVAPGHYPLLIPKDEADKGWKLTVFLKEKHDNQEIKADVRHFIYQDQSLTDLILLPLKWGLSAWVVAIALAIVMDQKRQRKRLAPQLVRGPEVVTVRQFNRKLRAARLALGIGFRTVDRSWPDRLLRRAAPTLYVPFDQEAESFIVVGDSGSGKTSIIRQILLEIERRGDLAIVNDPAREYLPQFFDEARGDRTINPLDQRMGYWNPSAELQHPAEALTIAESLFPDDPGEKPFFIDAPREVFAHLLKIRATPEEIIHCLSREDEILRIVEQTTTSAMIHKSAHDQRAGVLAKLNLVASALKLLPRKEEASGVWTATEWSQQRQGWLFFTTTPETRKAVLPLVSLWLDLLVLRLIMQGKAGGKRVWFVLDELAMLQHLPQLHTAITENRKSNNPVVLAFHARSQIEKRYGLDAKPLLSSPATKFFLRTSEPESAKWISSAIGDAVIARLHVTRSSGNSKGQGQTISEHVDKKIEPVILHSEIAGLDDRHGYVKFRNLVVPIHFPYIERLERTPGLLLRPHHEEFLQKPKLLAEAVATGQPAKPARPAPPATEAKQPPAPITRVDETTPEKPAAPAAKKPPAQEPDSKPKLPGYRKFGGIKS